MADERGPCRGPPDPEREPRARIELWSCWSDVVCAGRNADHVAPRDQNRPGSRRRSTRPRRDWTYGSRSRSPRRGGQRGDCDESEKTGEAIEMTGELAIR